MVGVGIFCRAWPDAQTMQPTMVRAVLALMIRTAATRVTTASPAPCRRRVHTDFVPNTASWSRTQVLFCLQHNWADQYSPRSVSLAAASRMFKDAGAGQHRTQPLAPSRTKPHRISLATANPGSRAESDTALSSVSKNSASTMNDGVTAEPPSIAPAGRSNRQADCRVPAADGYGHPLLGDVPMSRAALSTTSRTSVGAPGRVALLTSEWSPTGRAMPSASARCLPSRSSSVRLAPGQPQSSAPCA